MIEGSQWPGSKAETWIVAGLVFLAVLAPLTLGREPLVDDGYYYLVVARNLADGAGSTFDGEHPTNGVQPLWLGLLSVAALGVDSRSTLLAAAHLLQAAATAGTAIFLLLVGRRLLSRSGALAAVALWIFLVHREWLSGMESAVYGLALAATLFVSLPRPGGPRHGRPFTLGAGLATCFLARVDALVLAPFVVLEEAWRRPTGAERREALFRALLPLVGIVATYSIVNLRLFGSALPISGVLKRSWSEVLRGRQPFAREHGELAERLATLVRPFVYGWDEPVLRPLVVAVAVLAVWVVGRGVNRLRERSGVGSSPDVLRPLLPWALGGLASYLVIATTLDRVFVATPRYYGIQPLVASLLLAAALERSSRWIQTAVPALRFAVRGPVLAVGLVVLTVADVGLALRGPSRSAELQLEASRWLRRELPESARLGAWNAGALGWFAGRPVVNLDGLVQSRAFVDRHRHDLCAYWTEEGLTHLVDLFWDSGDGIVPVHPVPFDVECPDRLRLLWKGPSQPWGGSARVYEVLPPGAAAAAS